MLSLFILRLRHRAAYYHIIRHLYQLLANTPQLAATHFYSNHLAAFVNGKD